MKLEEEVKRFFSKPQTYYLCKEEAIAYLMFRLSQEDCYGTDLDESIPRRYDGLALSNTILYKAIQALEDEGWLTSYLQKKEGSTRGRSRRMLSLSKDKRGEPFIEECCQIWQECFESKFRSKEGVCAIASG